MERITDLDGLYHLDPTHSEVGFSVRHAGLSRIRGTFDAFHGYAIIDRDHVDQSAMMVRISTSSINTKQADRDAHLRNSDFFNVATHPTITFVGTSFRILDEEDVLVGGDLTILGTTRPIEITFTYTGGATDPFGNQRIGFEASLSILRSDYGLRWNAALETGGWMISDEVRIEIEASAVKQAVEGQDADLSEVAAPGAQDTVVLHGSQELDGQGVVPQARTEASNEQAAAGPESPAGVKASTQSPATAPAATGGPAPRRGAVAGDEAPVRGPRRGVVVEEDEAPAPAADRRADTATGAEDEGERPATGVGATDSVAEPEQGSAGQSATSTTDGDFVTAATPGTPSASRTPSPAPSSAPTQPSPAQDESESSRPWWRRLGRRG